MTGARAPFLGALGWHGRLAIAAILTTIIFMAAIAMVAFTLYQRVALDLVIERDARLVYLSAYRIREELAKLGSSLDGIARDPDMYAMVPAAQARLLRAEAPDLSFFDGGVVVLDSRGRVRTTVPERPDLKGDDWSGRDVFRNHLTSPGMAVSDAFPGGAQGADTVALSVPLLDAEREFVGVLAGMFNMDSGALSPLYASIVRLRIGQSGTTYVVDGAQRILYDSELGQVGAQLAERGPLGMAPDRAARAWRTRDVAGHDIIAATAAVPGTTWTLVSEEDAATLARGVLGYRRLLYTLMTLGIALPAFGVALMVQRGWTARDPIGELKWAGAPVGSPVPPRIAGWRTTAESQAGDAGAEAIDFLVEQDGQVLVLMAAVSGRHAGAELLMTARAALRVASVQERDPARVLALANRVLRPLLSGDELVNGLYARLDPVSGEIAYACAGYPEPVCALGPTPLTGTDDPPLERGPVAGPPLSGPDAGWTAASEYAGPGESVILAGPGLFDLTSETGERFGVARVAEARRAGSASEEGIGDSIVESMCQFAGRKRVGKATWSFAVLQRNAES